jgi:hypothetical protein
VLKAPAEMMRNSDKRRRRWLCKRFGKLGSWQDSLLPRWRVGVSNISSLGDCAAVCTVHFLLKDFVV